MASNGGLDILRFQYASGFVGVATIYIFIFVKIFFLKSVLFFYSTLEPMLKLHFKFRSISWLYYEVIHIFMHAVISYLPTNI